MGIPKDSNFLKDWRKQQRKILQQKYPQMKATVSAELAVREHRPLYLGKRYCIKKNKEKTI